MIKRDFQTIIYKPGMMQFVIDNCICLVMLLFSFLFMGSEQYVFHEFAFVIAAFLGLFLVLSFFSLRRKTFILTPETLVYQHGIFDLDADYIELYRVVDFQEKATFLQRLFGLKTVIVYSGDRTTPQLRIPGICRKEALVEELRARVEFNKTRRGVYEITNRY